MDATSWTSFTALHLPSVWKWEKGNADRRVERSKLGTLKCGCCSLVSPPCTPTTVSHFYRDKSMPCHCLPLKGRTSDRFAVLDLFEMWVLSIKVKSRGRDPSLAYLSQCSWLHVLLFRHGRWWNTKSTKDYPILFNSRTICVLLLF